jgi:glycosyltransferase involved in cell wall biosynthesis
VRTSQRPRISAILPTWNRACYLEKALQGLLAQTLEPEEFEVILVDDGSTDATRQVLARFTGLLPLVYLHQENAGIAVAKNRGVEKARAPILLFMDDDDVASPTLLEEHLWSHERYPDPTIAILGRTDLSSQVASKPVMHYVTEVGCNLFCYPGIRADEWLDYTFFWGGRSSCKTALLRDHGCFDPVFRFGCEDIELGYRLSQFGLRVRYNPRAVSTMVRAMSFDDFCRRVEKQGQSNWVFGTIHPVEEVWRWGDIPYAQERWAQLEPNFETVLAMARHLDYIATLRVEEGLTLDDFLVTELHRAYLQSFDGCRVRGIAKAVGDRRHRITAQPAGQTVKASSEHVASDGMLPSAALSTVWNTYVRSQDSIEIDIIYDCNLKCFNCNRSCQQAPTMEAMTVEQIYKFIDESVRQNVRWRNIRILGGEPTLHQELLPILELLLNYRTTFSPETTIQLVTNGLGKEVDSKLAKVPDGITIENSHKISRVQTTFSSFNNAPIDLVQFKNYDFSGGCWITSQCGIGLTPYGYYPCAIAGGIDRVFGFNIGRKELPDPDDTMLDLFTVFCRYCGHFLENQKPPGNEDPNHMEETFKEKAKLETTYEVISPTWAATYKRYKHTPPKVSRY